MKFQHKWSMGFFAFLTWFSLNTTFAAIDTCRVHAVVKNGINGRDGVEATLVFQLQKLSLKVNQPWSVIQESENLANILQVQQDKLEQQICVLPNVYHMHLFSKDFVEFEQAYDAFIYQNPIEFDTLPHLTASSFSRNRLPNWHEMFPLPVQRKKEILAIFLNYWSTQAQGELSANTKDKTPTLEELKLLESNLGFLFDIFSSIQGMQGEREFALTLEKNLNFDLNAWNLPIEEGHDLNQPGHIILKLSRSLIKKALRNTAESNIKKSYHYMEALNPRTLAGELEIYKKFCFTKYIDNEGNLHVEKPSFFQMYYLTFKKPLKYCVYIDPLSTSSTVLYHMGGAGSYAEDPEQVPFYDLRNKIRGNKFSLPHVISMSLGKRESLMIPHRVEYFVEKWSKVMEEDLQTLVRKLSGRNQRHFERFAIGISLGASSVLHVDLLHPHFFKKVASICPPVLDIDAAFPIESFYRYLKESGAIPYLAIPTMLMSKVKLRNYRDFFNSVNPLMGGEELLKNIVNPLFLSVGNEDELGLNSGVEKLKEKALNYNVPLTYYFIEAQDIATGAKKASHCVIPTQALMQFFMGKN